MSVDNVRVEDEDAALAATLPGGVVLLRRGKKSLAGVLLQA